MPPTLYLQNVIAFIWDFDRTLIPGYMQQPLFDAYDIDGSNFWAEVNGLVGHSELHGMKVSKDTAYLGHLLSYVQAGPLAGLTNERLRELGTQIELAPGMPDFMARSKKIVEACEAYRHEGITVEHYVLSTGLRQMILGTGLAPHLSGIWGSELISDPAPPGYADRLDMEMTGVVSQVGYTIDNTTKTRAIFEINKGVGSAACSVDISYEGRGSSGRMSLCRRGFHRSSSVTWSRSHAAAI